MKHMLLRDGRYYSRLVIPLIARPFLEGKTELRTPLGPDFKLAVRAHYLAIADMMLAITQAEQKAVMTGATVAQPAKYRLTVNQIAQIDYQDRLTQDQLGRLTPFYAQVDIDDLVVRQLRAGMSGKTSDQELFDLVGHRIKHFAAPALMAAMPSTTRWRTPATVRLKTSPRTSR